MPLSGIAQVGYPGQYPPGQYPPGRYPQPGIGLPRRGKSKSTKGKEPEVALQSFEGTVQKMDAAKIEIEAKDNQIFDFKRNEKTKFVVKGEEVEKPSLKAGDEVRVEASQDDQGYFTAVNVFLEKEAPAAAASPKPESQQQPSANEKSADENTPEAKATEDAPPPSRPDPDDPGPPKLRRGAPPRHSPKQVTAKEAEPPRQVASAKLPATETAPDVVPPPALSTEPAPAAEPKKDALIEKAREAADNFTETLPNYLCQEMMARFFSNTHPASWRPLDVVSMEVVYDKGKEHYRKLAVNGKATKKSIEEIGGAWSTGEFGTLLIDIFSPATAADFRYVRESRIAGVNARLYDFSVERDHSHWDIKAPSQSYRPAYTGSIWIDPRTARVLRIEMMARRLPENFPFDHVESATDYQYVRLGGIQEFLLPVHSESLSCQRGTQVCDKNQIDFRNYHKYSGEATITFDDK